MDSPTCEICLRPDASTTLVAREGMYGTGEEFEYRQCGGCGTLQLLTRPSDLGRYYADTYYSFAARPAPLRVPAVLFRLRTALFLRAPSGPLGRVGVAPQWFPWFTGLRLSRRSPILDVGSGAGSRLLLLKRDGFTDLTGVDPFVARSVDHGDRVIVERAELADIDRRFDMIMLHHSLEHMTCPADVLCTARNKLTPAGHVLVRVPLCDSWAFRNYGANWVQLDAPRHLYLYTRRAIGMLAAQAGFDVVRQFDDSWSFQFWGSEERKQGLALHAETSYEQNPSRSMFTPEDIEQFEQRAAGLNERADGDQGGFLLKPVA